MERVTEEAVEVVEFNEDGSEKKRHTLPSKLNMFIPGFRGVNCMMDETGKGIEGLCNPRGFVLVDDYQRNPTFKNVYAVGDIQRGASLVVWAIRDGREAAEAILEKFSAARAVAAE